MTPTALSREDLLELTLQNLVSLVFQGRVWNQKTIQEIDNYVRARAKECGYEVGKVEVTFESQGEFGVNLGVNIAYVVPR